MEKYSLIITTTANKESAREIAKLLVEKHLAACVQMFPIESIYFWKDSVCEENEIVLFIKSRTAMFDDIKAAIREIHSYEVPEIVLLPITDGLPEYLKWIDDCVRSGPAPEEIRADAKRPTFREAKSADQSELTGER